jgi:hypothetical protein
MIATTHARTRMQQRGLPPGIVDLLLAYGSVTHDHHGAEIYHFDKSAIRRLEHAWGRTLVRRLDGLRRAYAVVQAGQVITAGHRHKRLHRH